MKLALINGSPKGKGSATEAILKMLAAYLPEEEKQVFYWNQNKLSWKELEQLPEYDVLVLAFPLYVDCIPSHVLSCLRQLEPCINKNGREKALRVCALVNNGFYEAHQNLPALEVVRNFCVRAHADFIGGVAIGGGGMIAGVYEASGTNGPLSSIAAKLKKFSAKIVDENCCTGEIVQAQPEIPAILYQKAAERGFKNSAKASGLSTWELGKK